MSVTSKINLQLDKIKFSSNKLAVSEPSVEVVANQLYQKVLDGEVSAIDTYEAVKFVGDVADVLKKCVDETGKNNFTDLVRDEISKNLNGEKYVTTRLGTKFSLAEVGTKWHYDKCNDPIWNYYNSEIAKLDKLKKNRETYLKTLTVVQPAMSVVVAETGEVHEEIEINPPIKVSTSSFKTELLKG